MILVILVITVIFILLAFLSNQSPEISNPFISYFSNSLHDVSAYLFLFFLGFLCVAVYMATHHVDKKHPVHKKSALAMGHSLQVVLFGFLLAYVTLYVIAFIQLNVLAVLLNSNPGMVGVLSDQQAIIAALRANNFPPEIIASDKDPQKEVFAVASANAGKSNFYGRYVLPSIPSFLTIPLHKANASVLMIDNTLIITEINSQEMQTLSPEIGYQYVKRYFWGKKIKHYPNVLVLGNQLYTKYRTADMTKKIAGIDEQIKKLDAQVSSYSATVKQDKLLLAKSSQNDNETASVSAKLQKDQKQLSYYKQYASAYTVQEKVVQHTISSIPHELGVFEQPSTLYINLDTTNPHAVADFFETLVHEYLHYASYVSDSKHFTDTFFEEGLTEYFARQIIQKDLETSTNMGYPAQVKIITEMTNVIPESDFRDLYFTKDQSGLESTLDRVYGDGFYQKNVVLLNYLQYTTTPTQTLAVANAIMKRIGGKPLQEKDLFSTSSQL